MTVSNLRNQLGAYVDFCGGPLGFTMSTVLPIISIAMSASVIALILTGHIR